MDSECDACKQLEEIVSYSLLPQDEKIEYTLNNDKLMLHSNDKWIYIANTGIYHIRV